MADFAKLIEVFEAVRTELARPDNDYAWSSWPDREAALREIDAVLDGLRKGNSSQVPTVLFAPTGPLQETSLSSGWGDRFLELADQFDEAMQS